MTGNSTSAPIGLGVSGLGRGFMLTLPTIRADERLRLVAAFDPRPAARAAFEAGFDGRAHPDFSSLCDDVRVEAIYVASPHERHCEQVVAAARSGKHVLVEKPMALSVEDCRAMTEAAAQAGVVLVVGPSHGFDESVVRARELIGTGRMGAVRMISALNYTDFVYRPRRPEELDPARGGGVVFSQGSHQIDVARMLAGGRILRVQARTIDLDPQRRTEGGYAAFVEFEGGATASLVYSGYAGFDSDALCDWVGETGKPKPAEAHARSRAALSGGYSSEIALKQARTFGEAAPDGAGTPPFHEHFGFVLVTCEKGDIRLTPNRLELFEGGARSVIELGQPAVPRARVIDEFVGAVRNGVRALHDGAWGTGIIAACAAIRESAATGRAVSPSAVEQ